MNRRKPGRLPPCIRDNWKGISKANVWAAIHSAEGDMEHIVQECGLAADVDRAMLDEGLRRPSAVMLDYCGVPGDKMAWAVKEYDRLYEPVGPTIGDWLHMFEGDG